MIQLLENPAISEMVYRLTTMIREAGDKTVDPVKGVSLIIGRENSIEVTNAGCVCPRCAANRAYHLLGTMAQDEQMEELARADADDATEATADAPGSVH